MVLWEMISWQSFDFVSESMEVSMNYGGGCSTLMMEMEMIMMMMMLLMMMEMIQM